MRKLCALFALLLIAGTSWGTGSPMVRFYTQAHGDTIGEMRIDGTLKAWVSVWGNWHRTNNDSAYYGQPGGGTAWGAITGTLFDQSDLNTALIARELIANKGAASGYPSLDAASKVPTLYLGGSGASGTTYLRGDQTWASLPIIPSQWDSASVAANSWAIRGNAVPANGAGYLYNNGSGTLSWATPASGGSGTTDFQKTQMTWTIQKNAGLTTIAQIGFATAPTVRGTASEVRDSAGQWINYASPATIDTIAGWYSTAFTQTRMAEAPTFWTVIKSGAAATDTQGCRIWVTLTSANCKASADPALSMAGFRFVPGTAGGWSCYSNDGTSTGTVTTTGILMALNTKYTFKIVGYRGAASDSVVFFVNNARVAKHTTDLPAIATNLGYQITVTTTAATARNLRIQRIHYEGK